MTQKQSNSQMFESISGFVRLGCPTFEELADLSNEGGVLPEGHDATITSINWPKCFS